MDNAKSGESDASSGEEPNAKRCRRDPNAVHTKTVMVLLDSDVPVSKSNPNVVLMPNTIEMAQLKKPEKGRFGKVDFTTQMTQMDVLTALHSNFPILRTKRRLGCASAADNRTRLDFHGDKRIWNGALINRHTRGNSALYVFAEGREIMGNHESEESQGLLEGQVLAATQRLKQLSQMSSTADQRHFTGNHDEGEPEMAQRGRVDLTTQADHTTGGILQQGRSVVQKMQNDPGLQMNADPVAQASLKPVSMMSGSQQRVLIPQLSKQGSSLQQAPPAAAHNNDPVGTFFPQTTSTKKLSVIERKRKRHPNAYQEFPLLVPVSEGETTDSGIDSLLEIGSNHDTVQSRDIVHEISPAKGSTKGGDKFHILLQEICSFEVDYVACFQNCGTVHLEQTVNPFTLTGFTPKSLQGPGPVIVTLSSLDGSWWGGEAVFEYIDDPLTDDEYLSKVVSNKDMRRKLFDRMDKEMSSNKLRDGQTSDSFGKTGPGSSSLNQNKCSWSVKLLQLLVYKAAEIGGREFIQMIFSTSAGKVVFNSYRNCATLPEDVARTNGHLTLANYLQDVNSRLSKESNSDAGTESIDWLELKHADEEQSLTSGADEALILKKCKPPGHPESDDDESDYFADDEISLCSSPCHNNASDSENEDHSQISKKSSCEEEVNEEDNLPVEDNDSCKLPLHLVGNQLEVIPSMKADNAGYKHKQQASDNVESHSIRDDITEKKDESAVLCRGEVENWDTLGSEVISAIEEASTGTTSFCIATPDVVITNGSESGLDEDLKKLRMIDNNENYTRRDFTSGNQSPTENFYRTFYFDSLASKAEVEQDLKGEVLVVDLPPGNGSKETPASVEPEQRAHANNCNEELSAQDLEEQLRDLYNDLRVQATNNQKDSSVQDPAEHLRDRRNYDGLPAEAPGGETDDERADPIDVLRQNRSGEGSRQSQVSEHRGIFSRRRRTHQRSSEEPAAPQSADLPETKTSQQERLRVSEHRGIFLERRRTHQRSSEEPAAPQSADMPETKTSQQERLRVLEHRGIFLERRRTHQRSSEEPAAPQSADMPETKTSQQERLRVVPQEIEAHGHMAEAAFKEAMEKGRVEVYRDRIMLHGQDRARKTSLNKFPLSDPGGKTTVGIKVDPTKYEVEIDQVNNWQFTDLKKLYVLEYRDDVARIIAQHMKALEDESQSAADSNKRSKAEIDPSTSKVQQNDMPADQDVQLIDITPGLTLDDVTGKVEQCFQNLELNDCVKAKDVILSVWGFATQNLYHALHSVFLSHRRVYVLVHKLIKDLNAQAKPYAKHKARNIELENPTNQTSLDNLLPWLVSVHCVQTTRDEGSEVWEEKEEKCLPYLPPRVFVAGTHADKPFKDLRDTLQYIQDSISGKKYDEHVIMIIYVFDDTRSASDYGVQDLQNRISEVLKQEPYMGEKVPIRWFLFEKGVEALVANKIYEMELNELLKHINRLFNIDKEDEWKTMLKVSRDLGVNVKHGRTVVLRALWEISVFKQYDERPSNGGHGCFPSDNTLPVEAPAEQGIPEQGQQQEHGEQSIGSSPPHKETESLSQERHPTNQQSDYGQVNELTSLVATGGQASVVSCPIPEMEEIAGHLQLFSQQSGGGRGNDLNHSLVEGMAGGKVVPRQESISIQEPGTCQIVNGQHQPRFQQSLQANGLSYPPQEIGLDTRWRQEIPPVSYPIHETVPFAERTPDKHEALPPCYQHLPGTYIIGVSSTGEREHAVEHTCSRQELQLWRQESDRCTPEKATRNKMNPRENLFILEIPEVQQRRQGDVSGEPIAFFSSAIYTDSYEYKLGIRVYLSGVDNGEGRYVSIFVHMMKGEYDDLLQWPFTGKITLSILDRSGAANDISQIVQATSNVSAFQRPREAICSQGCGFVKFAPIEQVFHSHYTKKDKLLLKIEFFN